jgi:hypothetical protein
MPYYHFRTSEGPALKFPTSAMSLLIVGERIVRSHDTDCRRKNSTKSRSISLA